MQAAHEVERGNTIRAEQPALVAADGNSSRPVSSTGERPKSENPSRPAPGPVDAFSNGEVCDVMIAYMF